METLKRKVIDADTIESTPDSSAPSKVMKIHDVGAEFKELRRLMELAPDQIGSTAAEFHGHFDKIATYLMNSVALVINDKHYYRLVEIEFYLNGGKHPDVFTHSDKDQKTCGEWIVPTKQKIVRPLIKSPRVGLTLKKTDKERVDYLLKEYRYLNIPEQHSKGKPYIILALHRQGKTLQQICDITKTKQIHASRYIELYEKNKNTPDFFIGKTLNTNLMCEIYAAIRKG
ncbi:hypothetical protein BGZ91_007421 [Linnemannia elongata]|nr:hypothetical protein BGZ91_007421 [Linnemannia elongata]